MRAIWLAAGIVCGSLIAVSSLAATQYTYDQLGRIQSATYDNGIQVIYNYDAAGNRTSVVRKSGNSLSPVANPCSTSTFGTQQTTCNVLQNSYSPQGYTLTITAVGASTCGTTGISSPNVTYQLNTTKCSANYIGPDSFTYTIGDGHGHSAHATVFVSILAVNPPIANADSAQTPQNVTVTIPALANDVEPIDAYKPNLAIYSVTSPTPAGATASRVNNNTAIQYVPASGYVGMDKFLYTDTDGHGQYGSGYITVQVGSPPVAVNDLIGTAVNTPVTYNPLLNDSDPYGYPFWVVSVTQPSNGSVSLSPNNVTLTYTPNRGFGSTGPALDTFQYTITDGHLTSAPATESICVGIQAPVANNLSMPVLGHAPYQGSVQVTGKVNVSGTISCGQAAIAASAGTASLGTTSTFGTYLYWQSSQKLGAGIYNNYDSFSYTLTDPYGQTSPPATATVNVTVICQGQGCP